MFKINCLAAGAKSLSYSSYINSIHNFLPYIQKKKNKTDNTGHRTLFDR